eukprot:COSAG04_NODE_723_length_10805_cov_38.343265_6_plen_132_part_00
MAGAEPLPPRHVLHRNQTPVVRAEPARGAARRRPVRPPHCRAHAAQVTTTFLFDEDSYSSVKERAVSAPTPTPRAALLRWPQAPPQACQPQALTVNSRLSQPQPTRNPAGAAPRKSGTRRGQRPRPTRARS